LSNKFGLDEYYELYIHRIRHLIDTLYRPADASRACEGRKRHRSFLASMHYPVFRIGRSERTGASGRHQTGLMRPPQSLKQECLLMARSGQGANFRFGLEHRTFLSVNEFHYLTHRVQDRALSGASSNRPGYRELLAQSRR
jgi:hypothetical protein